MANHVTMRTQWIVPLLFATTMSVILPVFFHFSTMQFPFWSLTHSCHEFAMSVTLFFLHSCQLFNSNPFCHAAAMVLPHTLPFQNQVFTRTLLPFNCHPLVIHFPFHSQFFTISRQIGAVAAHGTNHVWLNNTECEPKINWINSWDWTHVGFNYICNLYFLGCRSGWCMHACSLTANQFQLIATSFSVSSCRHTKTFFLWFFFLACTPQAVHTRMCSW